MASHISSLEPRHTTLHTTLGVGLGVSWGAPSRIVVRHFSNFCLCPISRFLSFLLYDSFSRACAHSPLFQFGVYRPASYRVRTLDHSIPSPLLTFPPFTDFLSTIWT